MTQLLNRILNALVGFLLAAFKQPDPNKPLPTPPPFPVGTPPTPAPGPPLPIPPSPPQPAQPPQAVIDALKWNAKVTAFIHKWEGKFIPPKFGADYQCVALINEWTSEAWGVYWPRLAYAGLFVGYNVPGFVFIKNGPTNYPYPGDLIEWGQSPTLPYGHISLAIAATSMHFNSFDQNWPLHTPAHTQSHTYAGVSGWHRRL